MSKKIDMTGQQYGALTVIEQAPRVNGRTMWRCRCKCGKETTYEGYTLRTGKVTSCGCGCVRNERLRGNRHKEHIDLTGQRFGQLTAVEFIKQDCWLFRCDCGKEKRIRPSLVKRGEIVSCGHVLSETARKKVEDNVMEFADGTCISQMRAKLGGRATAKPSNPTGVLGVHRVQRKNGFRYQARLMLRGKEINLGTYRTIEEAAAARKEGELKYYAPIVETYDQNKNKPEH